MSKAIILLADGTGNSSGKLLRTNVWRLYQALDLADPPAAVVQAGGTRQVACYHDGVGTSSFKPLALLGGIFGWGLKRNLLDLYEFLCRTYENGDRIYAFGFSRGAFTVRVLVDLIATKGVLQGCTEHELHAYSRDIYRDYRKGFNQTRGLVGPLRHVRDVFVAGRRFMQRLPRYTTKVVQVPEIAFVGLWDTVAAYGTPLTELTRGIDEWVWPLSMPGYTLSAKVQVARHALALDDERDTFHPLLWDELSPKDEMRARVANGSIRQVWFSGMHSDVGGGYPDDSLAHVPLDWMMTEAAAGGTGLRFKPKQIAEIRLNRDDRGPMHDSRRGLAGYYRYQPRKLSARLDPPAPDTRIMRDPGIKRGQLQRVLVHESVARRIALGSDEYAPIVLPPNYEVLTMKGGILSAAAVHAGVSPAGHTPPSPQQVQAWQARLASWQRCQDDLWNDVWRRRVSYFLSLGISLTLASMPLLNWKWPPAPCTAVTCLTAPAIRGAGGLLPQFAQTWVEAFAQRPGTFLLLVVVLASLLFWSTSVQRRIHDRARKFWTGQAALPGRLLDRYIRPLRTSNPYQEVLRTLKWVWLPNAFGPSLLALGILAGLFVVLRWRIQGLESAGAFCPNRGVSVRFATNAPCWSGSDNDWTVQANQAYRLRIKVTEPWMDGMVPASPLGAPGLPAQVRYGAVAFRRSLAADWFQPLLRIATDRGAALQPVTVHPHPDNLGTYIGDFVAYGTGPVKVAVNDAVVPPWLTWLTRYFTGHDTFYDNNSGTADVTLTKIPAAAGEISRIVEAAPQDLARSPAGQTTATNK